jgi:hypothetical protein
VAGRVIRIIPRQRVILSASTQLANDQEVFLACQVDVSQWREMVAYIRLHTPSINTGAPWTVAPRLNFYQDGWTSQDPAFVSFAPSPSNTIFPLLVSAGSAFTIFALPANFGCLMSVSVSARPGGVCTFDTWLSVDLAGKE